MSSAKKNKELPCSNQTNKKYQKDMKGPDIIMCQRVGFVFIHGYD